MDCSPLGWRHRPKAGQTVAQKKRIFFGVTITGQVSGYPHNRQQTLARRHCTPDNEYAFVPSIGLCTTFAGHVAHFLNAGIAPNPTNDGGFLIMLVVKDIHLHYLFPVKGTSELYEHSSGPGNIHGFVLGGQSYRPG